MDFVKIIKNIRLLLIIFCGTLFSLCCENGEPKLLFLNNIVDFGQVQVGEKVLVTFKFKNQSNQSILINDITYDCHCVNLHGKDLPYKVSPHSNDSLQFTLDGAEEKTGIKNINIAVRTSSDPKIQILKIKGEIQ
ncbi:DUF1573 domain-containing protein [Sphingobacterium spiritivorum]|uniref:DUF1573 domain-containing protein n=1 Tax=Sphingobacterium spiritivorum TaxID=258 RepID=UPI003DA2E87B